MKILITGATGMAGSEAVREAILDPEIETITALVRRPLTIQHPKLRTVIHNDYLNYSDLTGLFKEHDACLWCLGISQTVVSKEEYYTITYEYAVAGAKAMAQANPEMTFLFLSGMGADQTEQRRTLFARVKGKTEKALQVLPFKKFYIARPGGIAPVREKEKPTLYEMLLAPVYPVLERIFPSYIITSAELAKAMLSVVKHGADRTILSNADLKQVLKTR
ncbi:MAG TPA: NAD(P)H-binding protein [Candidatus Kapabacteria bacterium]|nr:NAD(P)H-binding protein [Candidatus Kapabacteria bacterium]